MPPAVEAWSLNHWTAREVPRINSLTAMVSCLDGGGVVPRQGLGLLILVLCAAWYRDGPGPEGSREDQVTKGPHLLRWGNGQQDLRCPQCSLVEGLKCHSCT